MSKLVSCANITTTAMRACLNCQRRKSRCVRSSREEGSCVYCVRTNKTCTFETPPLRTPLTRSNIDVLERQCSRLTSLIRELNPDIDVDLELQRLASEPTAADPEPYQGLVEEEDESSPPVNGWNESNQQQRGREHGAISNHADGMATFVNKGSGYLGSSSGSQILEQIQTIVKDVHQAGELPGRSADPSNHTSRTRLPSPSHMDLLQAHVVNQLVDSYFLLYNTSYPILHESTFRLKMDAGRQYTTAQSSWRAVYYMVLAIGNWVTVPQAQHEQTRFYDVARAGLSMQMLESGTFETVQAFLLIGNYLQKRDWTNTGYSYVGLACRMALGIGLHREPSNYQNSVGHERRRQVFWTMYCFESGFNITTGRPPTLPGGFIDTRLPCNIVDKGLSMQTPVPPESTAPTSYSAIIAQAQLAKIADVIYNHFLQAKMAGTQVEHSTAESMERTLNAWLQDLPGYWTAQDVPDWFRAPRAVVLWKELNLRILLWRGSKQCHGFLPTAANATDRCVDFAMQSVHDISTFCREHEKLLHQGVVWYATYFLFQAALVIEASYISNDGNDGSRRTERPPWQREHTTRETRLCFKALSAICPSANRCLRVLDRIHEQSSTSIAGRPSKSLVPSVIADTQEIHTTDGPSAQQPDPTINVGDVDSWLDQDNNALFGAEAQDPNIRILFEEVPGNYLDNIPLDLLLNGMN